MNLAHNPWSLLNDSITSRINWRARNSGQLRRVHDHTAPNRYKLFSATVGVQVTGQQWVLSLDAGGLPMFDDQGLPVYRLQSTSAYLPLFDTCGFAGDSAADCALPFTRTVTAAVPEPSAAGLLLLGIGVGCAARRRKSGVASL